MLASRVQTVELPTNPPFQFSARAKTQVPARAPVRNGWLGPNHERYGLCDAGRLVGTFDFNGVVHDNLYT